MKTNQPKLKTTPRPLFSCAFFRHCTQTVLSPTTTTPPPLPLSNPAAPPQPQQLPSSSSSSSSNTSQSFTQWRFPLPTSPVSSYPSHSQPKHEPNPGKDSISDTVAPKPDLPPPLSNSRLQELYHVADLQFGSDSGSDEPRLGALHLLEKSLVPNPRPAEDGQEEAACPASVMRGVVECFRERVAPKPASKVLLALCLAEGNRRVAVEAGAVGAVVEALSDLEGAVAERSLAALELLCTVAEGAAEVRTHALAVPMMFEVMGRMEGRGKEYAISVLAVIYSGVGEGAAVAPPEEVARAVMLALRGDCSARGRRKGAQLLKILQESERSDMTEEAQ